MTPERYAQVRKLFDETEHLPPAHRVSYLQLRCGGDPDLLAAVERLLQRPLSGETPLYEPTPSPGNIKSVLAGGEETLIGRRVGPYEVRRHIGSGGMGSVFLAARVDDFEQQVALKLMKAGLASDELVQRFRTERQVLAGLSHPNIARLLDGGTTEDGLPYFVMEYIEGLPLDRYCNEHHLDARQRARLLLTVCVAVEHAHQQTVIHRDLKPGNVLVTADGTPRVLDFGLAKRLPGSPAAPTSEGQTQSGMILGTPAYMSPEQALGKPGDIGPLADVWALGALLYELLTGRPPFRADTPLDTIMQVLKDDPVPPSRLHPRLPRDLETIALKCLQKDPQRRYGSARELGDDLSRFLEGVPIQARPAGVWERTTKWVRRRPTTAALLGVSLLAALVLVIGGLAFAWYEAQQREEAQRLQKLAEENARQALANQQEAERQRDRAEKNFNRVFEAVQESLTRVSNSKELKSPDMRPFRKQLLDGALKQFEQFVAELGDDPRARDQLARAHLRVGKIHHEMGDHKTAVVQIRKGIELAERLAQERPASPAYRSLLALGNEWLGVAHPDPAESVRAFRRCLELREALLKADPKRSANYRSQLAFDYYNAGHNLGMRQPDEALRWLEQARAIREEQARGNAGRDTLDHLATINLLMGVLHRGAGRPAESEAHGRRAIEVYERLIRAEPDEAVHQVKLAQAHLELNLVQARAGSTKESIGSLERAQAILEKLVAREVPASTDITPHQRALLKVCHNLALEYREDFRRVPESNRLFAKVRDLCDHLLAARPSDPELHSWRAASCFHLGATKLVFEPDEALRLHEQARASLEKVLRVQPNDGTSHSELGTVLNSLGSQLAARGKHAEAVELLRRAVTHQSKAYHRDGSQPEYRQRLTMHYRLLGSLLRDLKQPAEAAAATLECARLCRGDGRALYEAACDLARCIPLVGEGATTLTAEQQAERRRYADGVVEQIRAAVAAGFRNARRMQTDEELDPLRDRADFRELLLQVEGKAKGSR
ncbi:MAG: protein kinase [Gemmataceae bacterium]|nr:protein kinase [Gemmataceae bacterium]